MYGGYRVFADITNSTQLSVTKSGAEAWNSKTWRAQKRVEQE